MLFYWIKDTGPGPGFSGIAPRGPVGMEDKRSPFAPTFHRQLDLLRGRRGRSSLTGKEMQPLPEILDRLSREKLLQNYI